MMFRSMHRLFARNLKRRLVNIVCKPIALATLANSAPLITVEKTQIADQHESLKYACLLNVNAASALLTSSLFTLESVAEKYKETLNDMMSLLQECLLVNDLNGATWDTVVALRSQGDEYKQEFNKLLIEMECVHKVVSSVIELSFNYKVNSLCTTLCEHSSAATEKIQRLEKEVRDIEQEYLLALVQVTKIKEKK